MLKQTYNETDITAFKHFPTFLSRVNDFGFSNRLSVGPCSNSKYTCVQFWHFRFEIDGSIKNSLKKHNVLNCCLIRQKNQIKDILLTFSIYRTLIIFMFSKFCHLFFCYIYVLIFIHLFIRLCCMSENLFYGPVVRKNQFCFDSEFWESVVSSILIQLLFSFIKIRKW